MNGNRRKHTRVPFHVAVDLHSGANFYAGSTRDLSEGGLFIQTSAQVNVGDTVQVRLTLLGKRYEVSAEVAWILDDTSGAPIGFGARFPRLPKVARDAIQAFMRRRAPMPFTLLADDPPAVSDVPELFPETLRTGACPPSRTPARAVPPPLPWTPSCAPPAMG